MFYCVVIDELERSTSLTEWNKITLHKIYDNFLELQITTGINVGQRILLPSFQLSPSGTTIPFSFKRRQLPIGVLFCMTINKTPGLGSRYRMHIFVSICSQ